MRLSFNEEEVERSMTLYKVLQEHLKAFQNTVLETAKSMDSIQLNLPFLNYCTQEVLKSFSKSAQDSC